MDPLLLIIALVVLTVLALGVYFGVNAMRSPEKPPLVIPDEAVDPATAQADDSTIDRAAAHILQAADLPSALNEVMDMMIKLTEAERGFILIKNAATGKMEFRAARSIEAQELEWDDFVVSNGVINDVIEKGEAVVTTNAQADPRYQQRASVMTFNLRSIVVVPFKTGAEVIGVIYCDHRVRENMFTKRDLENLNTFARQITPAVDRLRMNAVE
jgi:GAF domain-containing protein